MANHPKLIKLPGEFLDVVARLLRTAPPHKTDADRKAIDDGLKSLELVRSKRARKHATKRRQTIRKRR